MNKKYKTILADPPWLFEKGYWDRSQSKPDSHYPCMKTKDICDMVYDLRSFMDNPSHLYLWTPSRHLMDGDAIEVCKAWGYEPMNIITWCKPQISLGYYFRNSSEHLIFAIRGKGLQTKDRTQGTWFETDRLKHSQKPDDFYEIIEKMSFPPYLELFARRRRIGWTSLGFEIDGVDIRETLNRIAQS